jgi:hypothetical protein
MTTITLPEETICADVEKYRQRLVKAHVKTEEDLVKMSDEDIKKLYLKHEQSVVDDMSDQISKLFTKTWTHFVAYMVPIWDEEELETSLNRDVFIKAAVNGIFPTIFYNYGMFLAPVSMLATTAMHVDYTQLGKKSGVLTNGEQNLDNEEKSEESDACGQQKREDV